MPRARLLFLASALQRSLDRCERERQRWAPLFAVTTSLHGEGSGRQETNFLPFATPATNALAPKGLEGSGRVHDTAEEWKGTAS